MTACGRASAEPACVYDPTMHLPTDTTCPSPGITDPASGSWAPSVSWGRPFTTSVELGTGEELWRRTREDLLAWAVKTRSGFAVRPLDGREAPDPGQTWEVTAHLGPITVREPIVVVDAVRTPDRVALSYATRRGHPVRGEEAFIARRTEDGTAVFELRSVTAAAPGVRGALLPLALMLQGRYRARYLRALRPGAPRG